MASSSTSNLRIGVAVLALAVGIGGVCAAEPAVQPAPLRTSCYVGGQVGYARARSHWDYTNSNPYTATGNSDPQQIAGADFFQDRIAAGAQAGCNHALAGPWMVGIEAGFLGNPLNRSQSNNFALTGPGGGLTLTESVTTNLNAILSATGRIGVAVRPDLLLYGKGGLAVGKFTTTGAVAPSVPGFDWADTQWHAGWTVGAGVEYWLLPRVSLGLGYDYYRFATRVHAGQVGVLDIGPGGATPANDVIHRVGADAHTFMARISLHDPFTDKEPSAAATSPSRFEGTFSAYAITDNKLSSWNGTRGTNTLAPDPGKGYQIYSPTLFGIDYERASEVKVETRVKGGYIHARHETPNQTATYNGPVDTQVSLNATFLSFASVRPVLGLALNLPTGTSYLPGNQRFTRMDPDLVDVQSYGVGLNANPTAGVVFAVNEKTVISLSAGYAWQGVFIKEGVDLSTGNGFGTFDLKRRTNPADVFTANGNVATSFSERDKFEVTFAFMSEGKTTIDGIAAGRAGAKYVTNAAYDYKLDPQWSLQLSGSWTFQEKNDIVDPVFGLVAEPKNSNSHTLVGSIDPSYQATDRLRLGANYSVLLRNANFYDVVEQRFIPAKLKNTVGLSARYLVTPNAILTVRGSHSWVHENVGPLLETTLAPPVLANLPPSMTFGVWAASVGALAQF